MRLIDADKLKQHYSWWDDDERRTLFDQIVDAQPTVDAVKVVRCKDCDLGVFETYGEYGHYCCHDQFIETGEEYCAWAERKETDNDQTD